MARKEPMIFQSLVMLSNEDIEKERKKIKKQLIEGVVLLPCYIQLVIPQEPKKIIEMEGENDARKDTCKDE